MNNKYNIGDKVEATKKAIKGINLIKGIATIISIDEACSNGAKYEIEFDTDINVPYYANEEDLTPYIEEEQHNLIYTLRFDNPYGTNVDATRQTHTKEELVEYFIGSLKSLMIDSAKRGEFEIPEIKWEYTNLDTQEEEQGTTSNCDCREMTMNSPTVGLDYEKEYNLLLEEHAETKELLEIAKVALKLTTELISTDE